MEGAEPGAVGVVVGRRMGWGMRGRVYWRGHQSKLVEWRDLGCRRREVYRALGLERLGVCAMI